MVLLASHLLVKLPPQCLVVLMLSKLDPFLLLKRPLTPYIRMYFNQSLLIYKFKCWCNSTYIGCTSQHLEVRVRQHVPQGILNTQITSRHSQVNDLAIGEHLLSINSCRTRYQDDGFSVQHRARSKIHLNILEAIYIFLNHPSLCR